MSIARVLVEKHGRIAAVLFPASVLGGFAYSAATGQSPIEDSKKLIQGGAVLCPALPAKEAALYCLEGFGHARLCGGSSEASRPC